LVSGVNFGGAFGENINKEKKQNGARCPPHYILEPPPPGLRKSTLLRLIIGAEERDLLLGLDLSGIKNGTLKKSLSFSLPQMLLDQ